MGIDLLRELDEISAKPFFSVAQLFLCFGDWDEIHNFGWTDIKQIFLLDVSFGLVHM